MPKKFLEKVASAPAVALEKTVDEARKLEKQFTSQKTVKSAKEYWRSLGPGLTTGAADDDPSGIATYSQTGSKFGFQLLWLAPFTFPLMAIVQEMCARIGLVTGRGLAGNIRNHYSRWVLYLCAGLLFFANTLNIGADLGAMAKVSQLLLPMVDFVWLVIVFAVVSGGLQIFISYAKYAKYLKWLALILLSYVLTGLVVNLNWSEVARSTIIPSITFSSSQIFLICGILGTTISPYLFFWQTSQEVEEEILEGKTSLKLRQAETSPEEIKKMRLDVWSGMFISNLVMFFIIAVCAATLFANGITNIETAAQAAQALRPLAGEGAYLLFALGIIGTGLLAVPILAGSASYAISESFGWRGGLYRKLKQAYAFYGVIIISILAGLAINFLRLDAIKVLIYAAVVNGLVSPVILILIVLMSSNRKIMGNQTNHPLTTFLGWLITLMMAGVGLATVVSWFF